MAGSDDSLITFLFYVFIVYPVTGWLLKVFYYRDTSFFFLFFYYCNNKVKPDCGHPEGVQEEVA